jgi:hypothetical protein
LGRPRRPWRGSSCNARGLVGHTSLQETRCEPRRPGTSGRAARDAPRRHLDRRHSNEDASHPRLGACRGCRCRSVGRRHPHPAWGSAGAGGRARLRAGRVSRPPAPRAGLACPAGRQRSGLACARPGACTLARRPLDCVSARLPRALADPRGRRVARAAFVWRPGSSRGSSGRPTPAGWPSSSPGDWRSSNGKADARGCSSGRTRAGASTGRASRRTDASSSTGLSALRPATSTWSRWPAARRGV